MVVHERVGELEGISDPCSKEKEFSTKNTTCITTLKTIPVYFIGNFVFARVGFMRRIILESFIIP
jgi:hypothetical protein